MGRAAASNLPGRMRSRFLFTVLVSDLAALAVGLVIGAMLVFGTPLPWRAELPAGASLWPLVSLMFAGAIVASYGSRRMSLRHVPRASYGRAVAIVAFSGAFTALGVVIFRPYWSRSFVATALAVWGLLAVAHRVVWRARPWSEKMVLVTGEKELADDLRYSEHADVLDVLDPLGEPSESLDPTADLVVDLRSVLSDRMAQFISSWNLAGGTVRALTTVYEEQTGRLPIVHLVEGWELTNPVSRNDYALAKRALDTLLIVATSPLWLLAAGIIWMAVRLDSRGPAIYRQTRVGKDGHMFTLYKFRTMRDGAEEDGPRFASDRDDRLTRVGKVLRRFHVDEIPQLWNALRGDLSLVGPRPERPEFTRAYEASIPFYGYRHLVRPGLTGWAQVNYGYADDEAGALEKLTYDLYYVRHMSPWLDAQIIGSSLWAVVSGLGR